MPLDATNFVLNGHATSQDMRNFYNLFTGVMTDQPVTFQDGLSVNGPSPAVTLSGRATLDASNASYGLSIGGPMPVFINGGGLVLQSPGGASFGGSVTAQTMIVTDGTGGVRTSAGTVPLTFSIGNSPNNPVWQINTANADLVPLQDATRNLGSPTLRLSSINTVAINASTYYVGNTLRSLSVVPVTGADILVLSNYTTAQQGYVDLIAAEACEMWFNYSRNTQSFISASYPWGRLIATASYGGGGLYFETGAAGSSTLTTKMTVTPGGTLTVTQNVQAIGGVFFGSGTPTAVLLDGTNATYYAPGAHYFRPAYGSAGFNDIYGRWFHLNDGSNGVVQTDVGSLYLRAASGQVIIDGTQGLNVAQQITAGTTISSGGAIWCNGGTLYFSAGAAYLQWTGAVLYCATSFTTAGVLSISANQMYLAGVGLTTEVARGYGALMTNTGQGDFILGGGNSILYLHPNLTVGIQQSSPYLGVFGYSGIIMTSAGSTSILFSNGAASITFNGTYLNNSHSIQFNTTGNQIVWPNGSYISGNAGYVQGSSPLLKLGSVPIQDASLLPLVTDPRMPVMSYRWPDEVQTRIGFMANDVAQVLPDSATWDDGGNPAGYNPQELTAILWGAVRELAARVAALEGTPA